MSEEIGSKNAPKGFVGEQLNISVRTSDPSDTVEGDAWIRSDIAPDAQQLATLRVDIGGSIDSIPIFETGASESGISEKIRVQLPSAVGFIPAGPTDSVTKDYLRVFNVSNDIGGTNQAYGFHDGLSQTAVVFERTITGRNDPVAEGDQFILDYEITNTGDAGDGVARLYYVNEDVVAPDDSGTDNRTLVDEDQLTLSAGETVTGELTWDSVENTEPDTSDQRVQFDSTGGAAVDNIYIDIDSTAIPDSVDDHWPHDEGSGSTLGNSLTANDGTINGATWESLADAIGGYVLNYDGTDDITTLPNGTLDYTISSEFTLAGFIRPDGTGLSGTIISVTTDATDGWSVRLSNGDLRVAFENVSFYTSSLTPTPNEWSFWAVRYEEPSSNIFFRVGDATERQAVDPMNDAGTSVPCSLGALTTNSEYLNHGADDIHASGVQLTDSELDSIKSRRSDV